MGRAIFSQRIDAERRAAIIKAYHGGTPAKLVARRYGCHECTVRKIGGPRKVRGYHQRLSDQDVRDIREARKGGESIKSIAKRYEMSRGHIHRVASGKERREVQ